MRTHLAAIALIAPLIACEPTPPIVGGPCSYETTIISATVTEVDEDGALFDGPEGELWVPASYLGTLPEVGATWRLLGWPRGSLHAETRSDHRGHMHAGNVRSGRSRCQRRGLTSRAATGNDHEKAVQRRCTCGVWTCALVTLFLHARLPVFGYRRASRLLERSR